MLDKRATGNHTSRFSRELATKIRKRSHDGDSLVRILFAIADGSEPGARISDKVAAVGMLLDRGYGKAPVSIEINQEIQVNHVLQAMSTEQLEELTRLRDLILEAPEYNVVDAPGT